MGWQQGRELARRPARAAAAEWGQRKAEWGQRKYTGSSAEYLQRRLTGLDFINQGKG